MKLSTLRRIAAVVVAAFAIALIAAPASGPLLAPTGAKTTAYGKIPQDEYEEWREQLKPPTLEETLREDYKSFITEDGRLYIGYKASCRNCPFHYEFKKEEKLDIRFPA